MKRADVNQVAMNHVERFRAVMKFQAVDRLPRWEWAMWWDQTIDRWHGEGLPRELRFSQVFDIARYFGLDPYQQFWFSTTDATIEATQHHVEGMVSNMDDYHEHKDKAGNPSCLGGGGRVLAWGDPGAGGIERGVWLQGYGGVARGGKG